MFPDDGSDASERPERLRRAYSEAWKRVRDFLFDPETDWREREMPIDRLTAFFSRLCDIEEHKRLEPYVELAFMGLWDADGTSGSMIHNTLYDKIPADGYAIDTIRTELEKVAAEVGFSETPEYVANFTMNLAMTVHLTRTAMGEDGAPNRFDVETSYMDYLLKLMN